MSLGAWVYSWITLQYFGYLKESYALKMTHSVFSEPPHTVSHKALPVLSPNFFLNSSSHVHSHSLTVGPHSVSIALLGESPNQCP